MSFCCARGDSASHGGGRQGGAGRRRRRCLQLAEFLFFFRFSHRAGLGGKPRATPTAPAPTTSAPRNVFSLQILSSHGAEGELRATFIAPVPTTSVPRWCGPTPSALPAAHGMFFSFKFTHRTPLGANRGQRPQYSRPPPRRRGGAGQHHGRCPQLAIFSFSSEFYIARRWRASYRQCPRHPWRTPRRRGGCGARRGHCPQQMESLFLLRSR